jgi:hypothetical protein
MLKFFPHRTSLWINFWGLVNVPVENGIGDGGVTDIIVPVFHRKSTTPHHPSLSQKACRK